MIFHYLVRVWNPRFDQWDRRSFVSEIASHLAHYLEHGPDHLHHLMDINDWSLENLRTGEKWRPYRKPRIDVRVLLTSRDGLAIEWAPRGWDERHGNQSEADFLRINTYREIGDGHPNNRLFYLKDFGALMRPDRAISPAEGELIRTTDGYVKGLIDSLSVSFDVRTIDNFEALVRASEGRHSWESQVIGAAIFNVEERAAEARRADLDTWAKEHLLPFGLEMAVVCDVFLATERSAAKAARALTKVASKIVTTAQARKWLDALERRLGRFERKPDLPSARVIPLRPKKV
jgi:hypothetical protein